MCMKNNITNDNELTQCQSNTSVDPIDNIINKKYIKYMKRRIVDNMSATDSDKLMKNADYLAIITSYTRRIFILIGQLIKQVQYSNSYKVISQTHQPAHFLAALITIIVSYIVWPNLMADNNNKTLEERNTTSSGTFNIFCYLITFATHFGTQIWMTFVSGLALYFALPRHVFGQCQQILFPKYYALNAVLSLCTLVTFTKAINGNWNSTAYFHVIILTSRAAVELAVRLYLVPSLSQLMNIKYRIEAKVGSGTEVGYLNPKILEMCPGYQKINKGFRRVHGLAAASNMAILVLTFVHLHFLAHKIEPF